MDAIKKWFTYWYFRYELLTNIYMFEPWEKKMLNVLIVGIASMVIYSSWVYLPDYTRSLLAMLDAQSSETKPAPT